MVFPPSIDGTSTFAPKAASVKVIGNSKQTVTNDGTDYYVKNEGSYLNRSRYVYVDSVSTPTLNYFDNNGDAKTAFTSSIPIASSGSFQSATGTVFTEANSPALFNENISNTNVQGFDTNALGDTTTAGTYGVALNLLANQDDYQFNLITVPGLIKGNSTAAGEITTMINNAQTRGDNIAVVDLVNWNANISTVTAGAAGIDSSYAATYWPWLQTIDPDENYAKNQNSPNCKICPQILDMYVVQKCKTKWIFFCTMSFL